MKLVLLEEMFEKYAQAKIELYKLEQTINKEQNIHEDYYLLHKERYNTEREEQENILNEILNTEFYEATSNEPYDKYLKNSLYTKDEIRSICYVDDDSPVS